MPETTDHRELDAVDPLRAFRKRFFIPNGTDGKDALYFTGNSLGLMPKTARGYVEQELKDWETLAVEGHVRGKIPWLQYHGSGSSFYYIGVEM